VRWYPTLAKTGLEWGTQLSLAVKQAGHPNSRRDPDVDLPIQFTGTKGWRHPSLCHPEQPTCLWQVEKEMTLQNRCEARRAGR
jgi:hypothetical protein